MSDDDDVLTNVLSSRRIPHARSRNNQRGGGRKGKGGQGYDIPFDPLRAIGHYEVRLGSGRKHANRHGLDDSKPSSWLEIHQLTKTEDGLVGTFSLDSGLGRIQGMCVIAGSRKDLARIVDDLERDEDNSEDEPEDENKSEVSNEESDIGIGGNAHQAEAQLTNANENTESDESSNDEPSIETSDRKLNTRINSFKKNSFRNPKFWLQWKGRVEHTSQPASASQPQSQSRPQPPAPPTPSTTKKDSSTNTKKSTQPEPDPQQGYLIFVSNSCDRFDGTISCPTLGWDNLKMTGIKTRPHGTPCAIRWKDID